MEFGIWNFRSGFVITFACRGVSPHDTRQRVLIGYGQAVIAQFNGALDQFIGVGATGEEGVVGFAVKFVVHFFQVEISSPEGTTACSHGR